MLDILREYLVDAVAPEQLQEISSAHDLFDQFGIETADQGFTELLMVDDETDPGNTVHAILGLTRELQDGLLHRHGVRVLPETNMQLVTDILRGLLVLPDVQNLHDVIATVTQGGLAEERFAEVMALVTQHSAEDILPWLVFVSQALIQMISELEVEAEMKEDDEVDRVFRESRIDRFKAFMDFRHAQDTHIQQLVNEGVDAGFPFQLYVNLIGREFENMDTDVAATNLVGMAYLSQDGAHDPADTIAKYLDTLISSTDQVTHVNIAIRDALIRFAQHHA